MHLMSCDETCDFHSNTWTRPRKTKVDHQSVNSVRIATGIMEYGCPFYHFYGLWWSRGRRDSGRYLNHCPALTSSSAKLTLLSNYQGCAERCEGSTTIIRLVDEHSKGKPCCIYLS